MGKKRRNRIAIITLSKNNPDQLRRTVRSIALQSHKPDDHLVVDSSSDTIKPHMEEISASGGARYRWVDPSGIYPAMKQSLNWVDTDQYLWWLNSSDRLVGKNSIKEAHRGLDGFGDQVEQKWIVGQLLRATGNKHGLHLIGQTGQEFARLLQTARSGFPHPSTLFWGEALHEINAYSNGLTVAEDYRLGLEMLERFGSPHVLKHPLSVHSPDGITSQKPWTNFKEKSLARRDTLSEWTVTNEIFALSRSLGRSLSLRIRGQIGAPAPLTKWTLEDPHVVHFCEEVSATHWPACCEKVLASELPGGTPASITTPNTSATP